MPDEISFLCMLHNIGATSSERSLTLEEVTNWALMEPEKAKLNLEKLIEANYVQAVSIRGVERYMVTADGVRKALSMFS